MSDFTEQHRTTFGKTLNIVMDILCSVFIINGLLGYNDTQRFEAELFIYDLPLGDRLYH